MSNILDRILETKRDEVAARKAAGRSYPQPTAPRGFRAALDAKMTDGGLALIAEIKKASPSKGLIREDFDPPAHARAYAEGGATCLSVLTDEPYFQGHDDYLVAARAACTLPVLRKDVVIDPWQVAEARALGADAVLAIVAVCDDVLLGEIIAAANEHGLDTLVEVHDEAELTRAYRANAQLIGVNNRNLKDFVVDFDRTLAVLKDAPKGITFVAESGIRSHADIAHLTKNDIRAFLVGETLMRQQDVAAATRELLFG